MACLRRRHGLTPKATRAARRDPMMQNRTPLWARRRGSASGECDSWRRWGIGVAVASVPLGFREEVRARRSMILGGISKVGRPSRGLRARSKARDSSISVNLRARWACDCSSGKGHERRPFRYDPKGNRVNSCRFQATQVKPFTSPSFYSRERSCSPACAIGRPTLGRPPRHSCLRESGMSQMVVNSASAITAW